MTDQAYIRDEEDLLQSLHGDGVEIINDHGDFICKIRDDKVLVNDLPANIETIKLMMVGGLTYRM